MTERSDCVVTVAPADAPAPRVLFVAREGSPQRRPLAGYLMALGAASCFAATASIAARLVRTGSSAWDLGQLRILGSFAVLAALVIVRPRSLVLPRRMWGFVVVFGLVALLGTQATFYAALQRLPVAVTGLLQQVGPMAVLFVGLFMARRAPRSVWLVCGAAFAGLYLVSGAYRFELIRQDAVGIAFALASAACFASYFVVGERLAGASTRAIMTWGYAVAAAGWLLFDVVARHVPKLPPTATRRFDVVLLVVFGTLVPTVLNTAALRRLGAPAGALTTVATPALSGLIAWFALNEHLAAARIVGGIVTLAALGWIEVQDIRATRRERDG